MRWLIALAVVLLLLAEPTQSQIFAPVTPRQSFATLVVVHYERGMEESHIQTFRLATAQGSLTVMGDRNLPLIAAFKELAGTQVVLSITGFDTRRVQR